MKKKLWLIVSICVVLCVLALVLTVGYFTNQGYGISVGRYLHSTGGPMLIVDDSPICMSNQGRGTMFDDLSTGDQILVVHDGIEESYPARTGAYFCLRLADGSIADISEEVRKSLQGMGWYGDADCDPKQSLPAKTAFWQKGCFEMSPDIPEDWEYRIGKYSVQE